MHASTDTGNTTTELAHRANDGFQIALLWSRADGRLTVVVDHTETGESFSLEAASGHDALEAFRHPFAYAAAWGATWVERESVQMAS
jgi:hypothetical protein